MFETCLDQISHREYCADSDAEGVIAALHPSSHVYMLLWVVTILMCCLLTNLKIGVALFKEGSHTGLYKKH